jgi:DNA (cytosine-5)-methyltransferase 1
MRGFGDYESDDTASAIKARDHKDATDLVVEPPILIDRAAFNQGVNAKYDTHISDDPVAPSLVARGPHAVAFDGYNQTISDVTQTIRADKSDGDHVGMVFNQPTMAVRRLTPLECERLMGWPDDWTAGQSDTHRYKQCGNGVASPVAQWIGQQLMELDK